MKTEIMLGLYNNLNKDFSDNHQLEQIDLLKGILKINQDVVSCGLMKIHDHRDFLKGYPLLEKGLNLVMEGIDPEVIESIMINSALVNNIDLLESLIIIEGVLSIQMMRTIETYQLLLSYFSFGVQNIIENQLNELKIKKSDVLRLEELNRLLK